jgi:hypothetical protein
MIIKTALATAALAAFLPLAHSAITRANQTEALASNIVLAAKASAANDPGANARFIALQYQARSLAGVAATQTQHPAAGGWQSAATWEPR